MASRHTALRKISRPHSCPGPGCGEWLAVLGAEAAAKFAASINRRPPVDIRVNTLKTDCAALQASLEEEGVETRIGGAIDTHLEVVGRANLVNTQAFRSGHFEVQDRASQAMCAALPLEPGMSVVDLCAGAGGKSLALAARGAKVRATDVRSNALEELKKRARRADALVIEQPFSGCGSRRWPARSGRLRRNFATAGASPTRRITDLVSLLRPLISFAPEASWSTQPAAVARERSSDLRLTATTAQTPGPTGFPDGFVGGR